MNQKGLISTIIVVGVLIIALALGSFYAVKIVSPHNTHQVISDISTPFPSKKQQIISPYPSPTLTGDTTEATTLDVNLNIPGIQLQPVDVSNHTENQVYFSQHNANIGANSYNLPIMNGYYVIYNKYGDLPNPSSVFVDELRKQGWSESITVDNYDLQGDSAGGACGNINGFVGGKNGEIKTIDIEDYINPCNLPGGYVSNRPGRLGGTYIYVSKAVNINQIISSPTPTPSPTTITDITEDDNGKTFTYPLNERFSIVLDPQKHPLKNLISNNCPFIYISNLSLNGPNNYPIGFQATSVGSCIIKNGDFSATVKITKNF